MDKPGRHTNTNTAEFGSRVRTEKQRRVLELPDPLHAMLVVHGTVVFSGVLVGFFPFLGLAKS